MKWEKPIIVASLVFVFAMMARAGTRDTAGDLLPKCVIAVRALDNPNARFTYAEHWDAGYCMGYFAGAFAANEEVILTADTTFEEAIREFVRVATETPALRSTEAYIVIGASLINSGRAYVKDSPEAPKKDDPAPKRQKKQQWKKVPGGLEVKDN